STTYDELGILQLQGSYWVCDLGARKLGQYPSRLEVVNLAQIKQDVIEWLARGHARMCHLLCLFLVWALGQHGQDTFIPYQHFLIRQSTTENSSSPLERKASLERYRSHPQPFHFFDVLPRTSL
ncbi:hypothetical protein CVT25_012918, partial [Psilocybe cyanescens]